MKITKYNVTPIQWMNDVLHEMMGKDATEMVWFKGRPLILSLPSKFMRYG